MGIAADHWWLGTIGVLAIYATAVLTNIKAKMIGEFTLARIGPTEMKVVLALLGIAMTLLVAYDMTLAGIAMFWSVVMLDAILVLQLAVNLVLAVKQVNHQGDTPDTTEWQINSPPTDDASR